MSSEHDSGFYSPGASTKFNILTSGPVLPQPGIRGHLCLEAVLVHNYPSTLLLNFLLGPFAPPLL
jgi:hypothetical protein